MNRDHLSENPFLKHILIAIALMGLAQGCADLQHIKDFQKFVRPLTDSDSDSASSPVSVSIKVRPYIGPIKTQQTFTAIVKDAKAKPVYRTQVEWILARAHSTVGDIIEVGENPLKGTSKIDNTYAIGETNRRGESTINITSVEEGTTHIIAVVREIKDKSQYKAFAAMHWLDAESEFPNNSAQKIGTSRILNTMIRKASTGAPLADYQVKWNVTSGPAAYFNESGNAEAITKTDENGIARVTLSQRTPSSGDNTVRINVIKPEKLGRECCPTVSDVLANGVSITTWLTPSITLEQRCPPALVVGDTAEFPINLTNTSQVDATNVRLQTLIPSGLELVGANPQAQLTKNILAWNLMDLPAQASSQFIIRMKAGASGIHIHKTLVQADNGVQSQSMCSVSVGKPILSISQTCPSEILVGDKPTFSVSVSNAGTGEASNVQITNVVPSGMSHASGQSEITRDIGILPAGSTVTEVFTFEAGQTGTAANVAKVTGGTNLSKQTSCDLSIKKPRIATKVKGIATLRLDVTDTPDLVEVGAQTTYSIVVTNQGTANATNIKVVATIPDGMKYISSTGSTGRLVIVGKLVDFNPIPVLKPKKNLVFRVTVEGMELGDHRFRVKINADQLTSPILEEESTKFYR